MTVVDRVNLPTNIGFQLTSKMGGPYHNKCDKRIYVTNSYHPQPFIGSVLTINGQSFHHNQQKMPFFCEAPVRLTMDTTNSCI